jgi:hypothetical protein
MEWGKETLFSNLPVPDVRGWVLGRSQSTKRRRIFCSPISLASLDAHSTLGPAPGNSCLRRKRRASAGSLIIHCLSFSGTMKYWQPFFNRRKEN